MTTQTQRLAPNRTAALALLALTAGTTLALLPIPTTLAQNTSDANQLAADNLPIRKITLYRSGVASFERGGLIDGTAQIQLRFNADQVNDILKSMVVLDLSGKGRIDGISYASKEPLSRRLASFGVDIADEPTLATLLSRLRGAVASIDVGDRKLRGTILGGEKREEAPANAQQKVSKPYLNLVTDSGIESVDLTAISRVRIEDPELNAELMKALAALAEHRADRSRTVDVNVTGEGARNIVVAYVQEAPVWKTSYRLVLPDAPTSRSSKPGSMTVQGWAIVENTTDEDWRDVRLSLVSGRPVSFTMDLYEPLYLPRPEIPVPTIPGVMPRTYAGGVDQYKDSADAANASIRDRSAARSKLATGGFAGAAPAAPAAEAAPAFDLAYAISADDMAGYGAAAQARGVEAGEIFQFELTTPVNVERQRSAMLPILNSSISGRRVSIFSPNDNSQHPMRGVEITNTSDVQLMPGPISVYDSGVYAGDAQIGHVPVGDKRLLAYSVDLDITATLENSYTSRLQKVRFVKGVCEITNQREQTVKYSFTSKDKSHPRTIIVEHPRATNWDLIEPKSPLERTDTLYRFEVPLDAGAAAPLAVIQRITDASTIAITSIDSETMLSYAKQTNVSKAVLDAFREVQARQARVLDNRRAVAALEQERQTITNDQSRIRQNMNGIDRTTDLYKRYVTTLGTQENRLEEISTQVSILNQQHTQLQNDLEQYVANLNVE
ncbi:MAG: hypothetical protein IPK69_03375 [Phycisphaerales bacterium]|nr:MAG: hypothetical protein IPK69_03375 [Phycisphaerales bacterium]